MNVLYHYTDAFGLAGILNSRALWLTDYRYLNDPKDLQYGIELVDGILAEQKQPFVRRGYDIAANFHEDLALNQINKSVYIGSLTEEGDLLSQWRGYNRGLGFSIGFDSVKIKSLFNSAFYDRNEFMTNVVYDKNVQFAKLRILFDAIPDAERPEFTRWYGAWRKDLMVAATSFKDPHFAEEKEVRIVISGKLEFPEAKVRPLNRGFRPYWERSLVYAFDKTPVEFPLCEIIVGPSLPDLQVDAVKQLLIAHKITNCSVKKSRIPYLSD